MLVLSPFQLAASCVDGVTPDCSDAAECNPSIANSDASEASSTVPEAAAADASTDAIDEGDAPEGG